MRKDLFFFLLIMSRGAKKALLITAKILIGVVILWYIFTRKINPAEMWSEIKRVELVWLGFALLTSFSIIFLAVWRWMLLLRTQGIVTRFYPVFWATCAGYFFNSFLLGLTGGDLIKIYYATQLAPEKKVGAGLSVLVDRVVGLLGLLALATLVIIAFGNRFWVSPDVRPAILGLAMVAIFAALCAIAFVKQDAVAKLFRVEQWIHRLPLQKAIQHLRQINAAYHADRATLAKTIGISILVHILSIITVILIGESLNIMASPIQYFFVMPIINTATAIPISFGGLGVREGMFLFMFNLVGVGPDTRVIAMSVLYFGIIVMTSLLAGIFYVFTKPAVMHHEKISEIMADDQT